eukprot:3213130-Rhodomonas_salina.4
MAESEQLPPPSPPPLSGTLVPALNKTGISKLQTTTLLNNTDYRVTIRSRDGSAQSSRPPSGVRQQKENPRALSAIRSNAAKLIEQLRVPPKGVFQA